MFRRLTAVAPAVLALAACSTTPGLPTQGDQPGTVAQNAPVRVTLSGAVQKGPFVLGSSVTVTPAAAPSAPVLSADTKSSAAIGASDAPASDGQVFKTETSNDRGEFAVSIAYQGPATIEASGFYYNEATGSLSSAPITLRATTEVGDTDASTYVNLITHLTYKRVQTLVAAGTSVADAQAQAETELQTELGLGTSSKAADQLNLEGGDDDSNAYLFAVSSVFAQTAYIDAHQAASNVDGRLQELINTASAALALNGTLPADTKAKLANARQTIDNGKVEAALAARLAEVGSTAQVPDLDRVIPWSVPKAVTDCASSTAQSVSEGCRMAVCGAQARPLDAGSAASLQHWQTNWSACGDGCWNEMRCVIEKCAHKVGDTVLVDGACIACPTGDLPLSAASLATAAADHPECDADLGLAK